MCVRGGLTGEGVGKGEREGGWVGGGDKGDRGRVGRER